MRIKSIKLENFRDFKAADFNFNGKDASIYGANETGKTTLANAISWLLTDKPYTGEAGFTPKSIKGDTDAHNLNHAVTAEIEMADGSLATLRKDYHEIWTKKRGSATAELTGNETSYEVDGVPVKAGQFADLIKQQIGDPETIQTLSRHDYFASVMPWQSRREILLRLCGDVSDEQVIDSDPELAPLNQYRQKGQAGLYKIDDLKAKAEAQRRKLNDELKTVPARIDEANKAITAVDTSSKTLEHNRKRAESDLDAAKTKRAALQTADGRQAEITAKLHQVAAEIELAKLAYQSEHSGKVRAAQTALEDAKAAKHSARNALKRAQEDAEAASETVQRLERGRERIKAEIAEVKAREFDGATVCPTCGQDLPADQVDKAVSKHNRDKAIKLQALNEDGRNNYSAELIKTHSDKLDRYREAVKQAKMAEAAAEAAEANATAALAEARESVAPWTETAEAKSYAERYRKLEAERDDVEPVDTSEVDREIAVLEALLAETQQKLNQLASNERQEKRVKELEQREAELSAQMEEQELIVKLCEDFTRAKADLLTESINAKFERVRFRLFRTQINGGLKDDCEVLIPSKAGNLIPYPAANHAGQVNAGLEIINTLSEAWSVELPIVIDNAESVTDYIETNAQLIKLIVSADDKTLRVEI